MNSNDIQKLSELYDLNGDPVDKLKLSNGVTVSDGPIDLTDPHAIRLNGIPVFIWDGDLDISISKKKFVEYILNSSKEV